MSTVEEEIEQDLEWREAEMGSLKLLLASSGANSVRQRALLRACSAMLYAHYEGFCRFCWTMLLDRITAEAPLRRELAEPLAKRSMNSIFRGLRSNLSDESIWRFANSEFQVHLLQVAKFSDDVETESNLWPKVSEKINESIGPQCPELSAHESVLRQLVGRRNKIAHGEKLEIASLQQFQQFEQSAFVVMFELAIAVGTYLANKAYMRPPANP